MKVLDLFCGAGLAADGYAAAGFDVVGVDINPQPDYLYKFIQDDALSVLLRLRLGSLDGYGPRDFDLIHASPPCQLFTRAKHLREAQGHTSKEAVDLLTPTLALLRIQPIPWVVENVENAAPLMPGAVRVCGSSFWLDVQRHRLFLGSMPLRGTACEHSRFPLDPLSGKPRPWGVYHVPGDSIPKGGRTARDADHAAELFGLDRSLPWNSIKEGFPPVYTTWIGQQVLTALERAA